MAQVTVYVPDELWNEYSQWRDRLSRKEAQEKANTSLIVQDALRAAMKSAKAEDHGTGQDL